jgi:hypothetical protein
MASSGGDPVSDILDTTKRVRVTEHAPVACASCGGQYTDRRHVDFGSAWDGPVVNSYDVIAKGVVNQQIDDLIVCESCIREAAEALKMDDVKAPAIEKLQNQVAELKTLNAGQRDYIGQLERTVMAKGRVKAK